jgi:hypothetical protein
VTDHLHSYSSIYAIGHKAAADLFDGPVVVEEKIDGSQFSFMVTPDGDLRCRSKGAQIVPDAPEGMFAAAVATAQRLAPDLTPGWVYRSEYLRAPKHNTLAYDRVPAQHVIIFDIDRGGQDYLGVDEKRTEARRLGLEVVPALYEGVIGSADAVRALLGTVSCLGGQQPEGLVVKNYARFGEDKKTLMGKYVTERFKESHKVAWKADNPNAGDVVQRLIAAYRTVPRWRKAVQHLREAGTLTDSPRDIGPLLEEVPADVLKECREEIAAKLMQWAWPQIARGVVAGLPQWYKDELLVSAFADGEAPCAEGCP